MSATLTPSLSVSDLAAWLAEQRWSQFAQSLAAAHRRYGRLTERQEEAARNLYARSQERQAARQAEAPANPVTEQGVYERDGIVYRVKRSQAGRLYASRYNPEGARGDRFVYASGAVYRLSADDRISLERAKELGAQWSQCCVCGRDLSATESVEAGIGPVCAGRI